MKSVVSNGSRLSTKCESLVAPKEAFELPNIESHCLAKGSVASLVVVFFDATIFESSRFQRDLQCH